MVRCPAAGGAPLRGRPRARGDGPVLTGVLRRVGVSSPALAGMVRGTPARRRCTPRRPCARGDGPGSAVAPTPNGVSTPRRRGWSVRVRGERPLRHVDPAFAGMVRRCSAHWAHRSGRARARGMVRCGRRWRGRRPMRIRLSPRLIRLASELQVWSTTRNASAARPNSVCLPCTGPRRGGPWPWSGGPRWLRRREPGTDVGRFRHHVMPNWLWNVAEFQERSAIPCRASGPRGPSGNVTIAPRTLHLSYL